MPQKFVLKVENVSSDESVKVKLFKYFKALCNLGDQGFMSLRKRGPKRAHYVFWLTCRKKILPVKKENSYHGFFDIGKEDVGTDKDSVNPFKRVPLSFLPWNTSKTSDNNNSYYFLNGNKF